MPFIDQKILETYGIPALIAFGMLVFLVVVIGLWRRKHGKTKTVKAVVMDKTKHEIVAKYGGPQSRCSIVFLVKGKKQMFFYVSELIYDGYAIGQKGKLKYNGDRFIDFIY